MRMYLKSERWKRENERVVIILKKKREMKTQKRVDGVVDELFTTTRRLWALPACLAT